jgi:SRSO17 transposase
MISLLAAQLPPTAWHRGTGTIESHPSPAYRYVVLRVREYRTDTLGLECWLILQRSLDGAELIAYLSNAPDELTVELLEQAQALHGARKIDLLGQHNTIGLAGYETRNRQGWHHHMTLCLLAGAFLMQLQHGMGGKDAAFALGAAAM